MGDEKRPEWLERYTIGISEARYYSVFLKGIDFSVVKVAGHQWYSGGISRRVAYAPTRYLIVSHNNGGHWHDRAKEVHVGRLKKIDIEKIKDELNRMDWQSRC